MKDYFWDLSDIRTGETVAGGNVRARDSEEVLSTFANPAIKDCGIPPKFLSIYISNPPYKVLKPLHQ